MRFVLREDQIVRTVEISIEDGPVMQSREDQYRVRSRSYRPSRAIIQTINSTFASVTISGPIQLKACGFSSSQFDSDRWYTHDLDQAPDWVRELVRNTQVAADLARAGEPVSA